MSCFLLTALLALQLDAGAKATLVDAFQRMARVEVAFVQETYSDFFDPTRAGGLLQIERPGKMRMTYTNGEQKVFIMDGTTWYEHDQLADTTSRVPQEDLVKEPLIQLLLYGAQLDQFFLMDRFQREGEAIFRLRPRNGDAYAIEVFFGENQMPQRVEVISEDGEGTRLLLSHYRFNPKFPPETFQIPPAKEP